MTIAIRLLEGGTLDELTSWQKGTVRSWDHWKRRVGKQWTESTDSTPTEHASEVVRSVALVLLALLRRDFRWPADWNSPGPEFSQEYLVRRLIASARASSHTTAILEACLLPRYRETLLDLLLSFITRRPEDEEDDFLREPLTIRNATRLRNYLLLARKRLEGLQVTIQQGQPRQLVPVDVEHISREEWAHEYRRDFETEDDDA